MEAKVVVITGANNGIGLGLFKALAERGWRVAGLDLSVGNLPAERSFVCDVTDPGRVERVIGQVVERWGRIDALTRTLAMELEPYGIVVNLVYPLLTRTRSSSPLGIPASFMADPDEVGRTLADKIGSRRSVVTSGLVESVGVFATRVMPRLMGRFLNGRAAAARRMASKRLSAGAAGNHACNGPERPPLVWGQWNTMILYQLSGGGPRLATDRFPRADYLATGRPGSGLYWT